jgi:D-Tyr-tRNAtyr deacylase
MSNPPVDAGIPLLTEVIPASHAAERRESPPAPVAVQEVDEEKWHRLERDIQERVLHQVLARIDVVLEQRVRDSLADVLQVAVAGLADDIREGLRHSMRDAVKRAVAQEIAELQATEK